MSIQKLLEQELLKTIHGISAQQISKRFAKAVAFLHVAKSTFESDIKDEHLNNVIYTKIYDAVRKIGEVFLLLKGYKAKGKDYHKTVIRASRLLMNDDRMDIIFTRLDKMRKNRHEIEYDDSLDATKQDLEQAFKDAQKFANKVESLIDGKDSQKKLI